MFDTGDPSGQLDKMGKMGKGAGGALAKLGEIGIEVMSALLDYLPSIIQYFQGLTGEDISNGVKSLVTGFQGMIAVITVVARTIGGLWHLLKFVGVRMGELVAMWIDSFMTLGSVMDSALSGDFYGAWIKSKNWGIRTAKTLTGTSDAQSEEFKAMMSSFSGGAIGGSEGDKKSNVIIDKNRAINSKVAELNALVEEAGGEEAIKQRLLKQKGSKEMLHRDASLMNEIVGLRLAIKQLAEKDLVARIETVTVAKAAKEGEAHQAGRSLAPMPVGF
jgi:hypothetical protein